MRMPRLRVILVVALFGALVLESTLSHGAVRPRGGRRASTRRVGRITRTPRPSQRAVRQQRPRETRILFIVSDECDACDKELTRLRRRGGDFVSLRRRGWRIGESPSSHIQLVNADHQPDVVQTLDIPRYPWVVCVEDGEVVRSFTDGCSTPLDSWTFRWLMTGKNERPTEEPSEEITVEWTGHYPLRGRHWSVEGDYDPPFEKVVKHLQGPNHIDQIPEWWPIADWSYEELRSLHDDVHEKGEPKPLVKEIKPPEDGDSPDVRDSDAQVQSAAAA